jgi:hypothetical protein
MKKMFLFTLAVLATTPAFSNSHIIGKFVTAQFNEELKVKAKRDYAHACSGIWFKLKEQKSFNRHIGGVDSPPQQFMITATRAHRKTVYGEPYVATDGRLVQDLLPEEQRPLEYEIELRPVSAKSEISAVRVFTYDAAPDLAALKDQFAQSCGGKILSISNSLSVK